MLWRTRPSAHSPHGLLRSLPMTSMETSGLQPPAIRLPVRQTIPQSSAAYTKNSDHFRRIFGSPLPHHRPLLATRSCAVTESAPWPPPSAGLQRVSPLWIVETQPADLPSSPVSGLFHLFFSSEMFRFFPASSHRRVDPPARLVALGLVLTV